MRSDGFDTSIERKKHQLSLLDDANLIVSEREQAYYQIMMDLYFMALLSNEHDQAAEIWREAQVFDSFSLSSALASARHQATLLTDPPRSRAIKWRFRPRARRHLHLQSVWYARRHR